MLGQYRHQLSPQACCRRIPVQFLRRLMLACFSPKFQYRSIKDGANLPVAIAPNRAFRQVATGYFPDFIKI